MNNSRWCMAVGDASVSGVRMSKSGKRRMCPAAGREISSAECGEGRGSRFTCPAHCGFSPLAPANYSQLLELEEELDRLSLARLDEDSADRPELAGEMRRTTRSRSPHALHAQIVWRFLFQTDANGRTCAQRWEQAGFPGLKNDTRVLMRAKMKLRVALLEVHRVLDDEQVEVVDLLETQPRPFIVQDRGFASSAARFATGLTWTYPLPHYQRMFGSAILLPEISGFDPEEIVREIARHLGGPVEEQPLRRWLAEHFERFNEALTAVGLERRRMMFANIDAKFGKAVYELKAPFATCCEALDGEPDVDVDDLNDGEQREGFADARVWFANHEDADLARRPTPDGQAILGRVLLGQSHWRLEAMGAEKLAVLRRRFERHMGGQVRFSGERLDDFGKTLAEKDPRPDLSLVPPRLLENPNKILLSTSRLPKPLTPRSTAEMEMDAVAAMDLEFLNHAVPALDGRTPREAARDPKLRPKLIRLMKDRVRQCDERNLDNGSNHDTNWMLRELGLNEILFDPPPAGRVPITFRPGDPSTEWEDGEFEGYDDDDGGEDESVAQVMDPALPCAPPLPNRPFTAKEVETRLRAVVEGYELAADATSELQAEGCTLLADVDEVTVDLVDDDSYTLLIPLLLQIWRAFVPAGTRGFNVPRATLRDAILREATALTNALKQQTPAAVDRYLNGGAQPVLAQMIFGQMLSLSETMPRKSRPSPEKQAIIGAVLRAAIEEVDRANRVR